MQRLRIALISDLHIGREARGLDLCPHELDASAKIARSENYLASFEEIMSSEGIKSNGKIDMLCITGDISNTAHAAEFALADKAISRISAAAELSEDAIFYVPGNHDVNWPVMDIEPPSFWSQYRYAPLLQDNLYFKRKVEAAQTGSFNRAPFFATWETEKALIIGINSAAHDGPKTKPHNGNIKQETVDALEAYLSEHPCTGKLRLCLIHHHLSQYSEPIPDTQDFSISVNSENLIAVLTKHKIDIILHGHKHYPRLGTHQLDNSHPFLSLCAGSFSAILHPLYYEGIPNLFHIINIHDRDASSGQIRGNVESWAYSVNKWVPGRNVRGLHPVEAFGSNAGAGELKKRIQACIKNQLQKSTVCEWANMIKEEPHLEHIRTDLAYSLLEEAAAEGGLQLVGDKGVISRNWVIFKRQ